MLSYLKNQYLAPKMSSYDGSGMLCTGVFSSFAIENDQHLISMENCWSRLIRTKWATASFSLCECPYDRQKCLYRNANETQLSKFIYSFTTATTYLPGSLCWWAASDKFNFSATLSGRFFPWRTREPRDTWCGFDGICRSISFVILNCLCISMLSESETKTKTYLRILKTRIVHYSWNNLFAFVLMLITCCCHCW